MHQDPNARLDQMERRLARVEQLLDGLQPRSSHQPSAPAAPSPLPAPISAPGTRTQIAAEPRSTSPLSAETGTPVRSVADKAPAFLGHSQSVNAGAPIDVSDFEPETEDGGTPDSERDRLARKARVFREEFLARATPTPVDWSKIESLIAGKWYALVGALVVTIGVALFVQYAVKQGWLANIPGSVRCGLGAALGFALIGAGEWARRRLNDWASVGLTAGGLGAVYVSAYASYSLYKLLDPGPTLLLLAAVAAIGVTISALTSLSAVAVVSLIGAYLAPIIASSGREGHVYVPAYWLALLTVGQVLAIKKRGNFVLCRWLTSLATLGFGFGWCMEFAKDSPWIGMAFLAAAWMGVHAELWYTASRADRANLPEPYERDLHELENAEPLHIFQNLRLRSVSSLSYSGWAVLLALHLAMESGVMARSIAPGVGCVAALVLAGFVVGTHRLLNTQPTSRREVLAAALMCASGSFLVATIAIALSGFAQAMTLCGVGLGALAASRWLRARVLDLYGLAVLSVAAFRIVLFDSWQLPPDAPALSALGFHLTSWSASTAGVAIAWLAYAAAQIVAERPAQDGETSRVPDSLRLGSYLRLERRDWQGIATFALTLGIFLLGVSLLHEKAARESIAVASVTTAFIVALAGQWRTSLAATIFAALLLLLPASVFTLMVDWFDADRLFSRHSEDPGNLLGFALNAKMLCGWYFALVALVFAWLTADDWYTKRALSRLLSIAGVGMLFLALCHTRSETSSLCFVWLTLTTVLALASRHVRGMAFSFSASCIWIIVLVAWVSTYVGNNWTDAKNAFLLYPGLWIGLALAGVVLLIALSASNRLAPRPSRQAMLCSWTACTLLVLLATSLEIARTAGMLAIDQASRGAAVSVWWGVFAIMLLAIGFWRHEPYPRRAGLALLALGVAKALIFDLASVSPGWRSVSVVVLGLFMVGVGVIYAQISRRLATQQSDGTTPERTIDNPQSEDLSSET